MTRIVRAVVAAATAAMLAVLTGCGSTDTDTGTLTAAAGSAGPTGFAAAGSDPAQQVADQAVFPAVSCGGGPTGHHRSGRGRCRRRVDGVGAGR